MFRVAQLRDLGKFTIGEFDSSEEAVEFLQEYGRSLEAKGYGVRLLSSPMFVYPKLEVVTPDNVRLNNVFIEGVSNEVRSK